VDTDSKISVHMGRGDRKMNLSLTRQEAEIILSLTADTARKGGAYDALWRKISKEVTEQLLSKTGE
jgi:hypothetical protein